MQVVTSEYAIKIEGATSTIYNGELPYKHIVKKIMAGNNRFSTKTVYQVVRFLVEVGAPIPESMFNIRNGNHMNHNDNGYHYIIWLIAPDVCPIEPMLESTFAMSPYVWAERAWEIIDELGLGIHEHINLLKFVRIMRIQPPDVDYHVITRNKEARANFLAKYSTFDAFHPEVISIAHIRKKFNEEVIITPKFASKNQRKIDLDKLPTREEFFERFHEATFGIFKEFEYWDRACIAGGMISKLLTGDKSTDASDIDVFIVGSTMPERVENFTLVSTAISTKIKWLYPGRNIYVIPRSSVMSIYVANTSIKIQIISSMAKSLAETITRFDFSPSCAGVVGDTVYITHDFLESLTTGVATPVNARRITPHRIIKLLWRGWSVYLNDDIRAQIDVAKLASELESKDDPQLVAELDACMTLTPNDAFNILLLTKLNENSTISMDVNSGLNMIEFNADFGGYMRATFGWRKFFKAMEKRVITPPRGHVDVTIPVANAGRALILSAEQVTIAEAPTPMQREQYAFKFTCDAEPDFLQFCRDLNTRAYSWWGNAVLAVPCVEDNRVVFYIPRDYQRRKFFTNEIGDEVNPTSIKAGAKIALVAFKITMKYRHYPGVYLECTAGIIAAGARYTRMAEHEPAEESAVLYVE